MFASNGLWGHYAIMCFSDHSNGGAPCTGAPSNWTGIGGTSIASPVMAGIQALVNQSAGGNQGNPNYVYYALAVSAPSVFHSITSGDMTVNCGGTQNCYGYGRNTRLRPRRPCFRNYLWRGSFGFRALPTPQPMLRARAGASQMGSAAWTFTTWCKTGASTKEGRKLPHPSRSP